VNQMILVAASGLAREVLAAIRADGSRQVLGFVDDADELQGTVIAGLPVLGTLDDVQAFPDADLAVCIGAGAGRRAVVERLAKLGVGTDRYPVVVDPSVRVPSTCAVGVGSILLAQVVLTASVTLGRHVVAMPHVAFTHDDDVADFATFAAGVCLGGGARVGETAYLGMNSSVRQGLSVGAGATLGMGAALTHDLPAGQTWAGVPARRLGSGQPHCSSFPPSSRSGILEAS
jgi:sugar O-acyltransferase (sialic acid O-acetyltransferase NeuD family)